MVLRRNKSQSMQSLEKIYGNTCGNALHHGLSMFLEFVNVS